MGGKKGGPVGKALGQAGSAIGKAINSNVVTKGLNAYGYGIPGAAASVLQGKDPTRNTPIAGVGTVARGGDPVKNTPLDPKDPGGFKEAKKALSSPEGAKIMPTPGPVLADTTSPVTQDQVDAANTGVTSSLGSLSALVAALKAQNNPVNQSSVYNALNDYSTLLGGAGGLDKQQAAAAALGDIYGKQQDTAKQLQGIADGTGPNPAMAALNQRTGENVANQAALMAGQRGAGANIGMMARQAAQQGGNTQQQAVGQGATMQAQQSLNALGQIGGQQSAMGATQTALGNIGTTQVGAGQTALDARARQANTMAADEIAATQGNVTGNVAHAGQVLGAKSSAINAGVAARGSVTAADSALAVQGLKTKGDLAGGAMNGLGAGIATLAKAAPAVAPLAAAAAEAAPVAAEAAPVAAAALAGGGEVDAQLPTPAAAPDNGMSSWGEFMKNLSYSPSSPDSALKQGASKGVQGLIGALSMAAMAQGGLAAQGGGVSAGSPAQAATVQGNSYSNDKIPAVLSEGEVVIPRSIMLGKDPVRGAADFVAKILAKKGRK